MRTTTSAASGLRASAPAKINPINRLGTITLSSFLKHQAGKRSAGAATKHLDHIFTALRLLAVHVRGRT
jgi:hypothetical protein